MHPSSRHITFHTASLWGETGQGVVKLLTTSPALESVASTGSSAASEVEVLHRQTPSATPPDPTLGNPTDIPLEQVLVGLSAVAAQRESRGLHSACQLLWCHSSEQPAQKWDNGWDGAARRASVGSLPGSFSQSSPTAARRSTRLQTQPTGFQQQMPSPATLAVVTAAGDPAEAATRMLWVSSSVLHADHSVVPNVGDKVRAQLI